MNRELEGAYALWKRELIIFFRSKSRLFASLGMPFFFLAIMGTGLNRAFSASAPGMGGGYLQFMAPGVLGMVLMMGSVHSGIIVIMDRQFGFLKETLVAPVSRLSVVVGKALGGATTAMFQGMAILLLSMLLGAQFQAASIALLIPFMFLICFMFVSLGIVIASTLQDLHGFQLVMNLIVMPMFFLSGALFPMASAPEALQAASVFDPLTYGVNGLRHILTGASDIAPAICLTVLLAIASAFILLAIHTFGRIEE